MKIRTSPHLKKTLTVRQIMDSVTIALLPVSLWSIYLFGLSAFALLLTTTLSCVGTEALFNRLAGKPADSRKGFWSREKSVVITGLLLGLTLPPGFALWMAALSGFVAIALGKVLFGGLGQNPFNPALVGRAFAQAAFPVSITTWTPGFLPERFSSFIPSTLAAPFMTPADSSSWINAQIDGWSGATPLKAIGGGGDFASVSDLMFGTISGSSGETAALLILLCGAWLVWKGVMGWKIPAAVMLGTALTSLPFWLMDASVYPSPVFMLFSGGLMLAAVFMATDMVGTPLTEKGIWIYGLMIGALTVIIRLFGSLPEGAMYAVLIGNACAPLIDSFTQPTVFGSQKRAARKPVKE
ncbi:RnfABCDGE type electron transport complex subunit D [Sansalvadorimonas sp. 2012CJ34-2]|uniref:Ion-translocating oxidoreductase complex subunit D n=1 Tax=Parendozoicomonas callyspongiae TaxID=2942213 RepID=A0ABT0PHB8_9GAMM|nr:RnfABCDGE type electron transport complex subunit D [Sansalvadorimonas sp. 2012CJ34-2]MCL6270142.1 RnfABCDGE type electron transport complex subunit D [Sansalvadorimonas sp. 2012CJ34-2]